MIYAFQILIINNFKQKTATNRLDNNRVRCEWHWRINLKFKGFVTSSTTKKKKKGFNPCLHIHYLFCENLTILISYNCAAFLNMTLSHTKGQFGVVWRVFLNNVIWIRKENKKRQIKLMYDIHEISLRKITLQSFSLSLSLFFRLLLHITLLTW